MPKNLETPFVGFQYAGDSVEVQIEIEQDFPSKNEKPELASGF